MNKEIILEFDKKDFEDIYFKDNKGNYFKDPVIKYKFYSLTVSILFLCFGIYYYIKNNELGFIFISGVIFIFTLINYTQQLFEILKWKKEVSQYLKKQEKYKNNKLHLTINYFSIIQDETESIEKWENIKKVNIFEDYIFIEGGNETYMIPNKSMKSEEYIFLKEFISKKLKSLN